MVESIALRAPLRVRHGQKASEVLIYHFVGKGYQQQVTVGVPVGELEGDLEFLMRAALKVNNIREDLGKVGPVIAKQVEEAMLGQRRTLDTTAAEKESEPVRRLLKFERQVRDQIEKLREQLQETRSNLRLTPENIESVVKIGLELAKQPPLISLGLEENVYHLPPLKGSWAACSEGLAHPHTGETRPIVFDPNLAHGRDDVVLVHLNHRLMQMCLRLLRAEVWSREGQKNLHRVTARLVPNSVLEVPAVVAYGRLMILGGDQLRLHEEVITAGGILKEGRFSRLNVLKVRQVLDSALPDSVPDKIKQRLVEMWDNYAQPLMRSRSVRVAQSLEVRQEERSQALQKSLQDRCEKEVADITAVLNELRQSIIRELEAESQPIQLELFNTVELEQFEREALRRLPHRTSLEARLNQIPVEIEQETAAIRSRFANPTPRLFPLAFA